MPISIRPEEQLVLLCADIEPDLAGIERLDQCVTQVVDWDYASALLADRAAAPLFLNVMPRLVHASLVPVTAVNKWHQVSQKSLARNMVLSAHFAQIVTTFNQLHIPMIALKGIVLSDWLYGNIGLRQFSDLDLLVSAEASTQAVRCLESMGYQINERELTAFITKHDTPSHLPPLVKSGVSVEIHTRIHRASEAYQIRMEPLWQRAVPVQLHGVESLSFCPEDQLLHICLHLDKHFKSGSFQFTCLYDLLNLINHKGHQVNWDSFITYCRETGVEKETFRYLLMVSTYMHARLPESVKTAVRGTLTTGDERKLLDVLKGERRADYAQGCMQTIHTLKNPAEKFHYLANLFFPSKAYMIKRYQLKSSIDLWWCYPFRLIKAVIAFTFTLKSRVRYGRNL